MSSLIRKLLFLALLCTSVTHTLATRITETERSIDALKSQSSELTSSLNKASRQYKKAIKALKQIDQDIAEAQLAYQGILTDIATTETQLNTQQESLNWLTERHTTIIASLKRDLQQSYRAHREPWLKSLLSENGLAQSQRINTLIGIAQQARKHHGDDFKASIAAMEAAQLAIEASHAMLQEQQESSEQHQEQLADLRKEQLRTANVFKKEIKTSKAELKSIQANERSLKALLSRLRKDEQAKLAAQRAPKKQRFAKSHPKSDSSWPVSGSLAHSFGESREGGKLKWQGWFIKSARGKPVKAVADGQVIYSNWHRGFGMMVIIDHGADYHTLYAHADALTATEGQTIKQGDVIAYTGSSGGAEQPGIYFEVRHQGQAINPKKWLKKA